MQFSFDAQQLEFRAQMRAFVEKECTPSQLRDAWDSELGWSRARWSALSDMGVVAMTVPEELGGLGLAMTDLVLVLEEAGRACLPEPVLETAALALPLMVEARGARAEELRARWLPEVVRGEAPVGVGLARGRSSGGAPTGDGSEGPARTPSVSAVPGASLLLLERFSGSLHEVHAVAVEDVETVSRPALDASAGLAAVTWEPSTRTLVAEGAEAERLVALLRDRAATAAGAMLVGLAERMVSMAAGYAIERRQFGRAIGSFQAIKHHLANALIRLEFARPVVYRAAWSLDTADPDASLHSSMAKAQASDAAVLAARIALQVHGAIGYTWEHDLHMWMKRAWWLSASWGDAGAHRARLLEALVARKTIP